MNYPFQFLSKGDAITVTEPEYGNQHRGIAPGGAMDKSSFKRGVEFLDNKHEGCLEFVMSPKLKITKDIYAVLTGAGREVLVNKNLQIDPLLKLKAGDEMTFSIPAYGYRSYFTWTTEKVEKKTMPALKQHDPEGKIRVYPGPEFKYLDYPENLLQQHWFVSPDSNRMGIRLTNKSNIDYSPGLEMVSAPVADGTVQLTPSGEAIVLMRDRQTIGGYPRILNVCKADLNRLAQFRPGQVLHFRLLDPLP